MTHPPPPAPSQPRPASLRSVFFAFNMVALQGFGGVLAVAERELVEKHRWLTPEQFLEDWAVAQTVPGPNVINLSLIVGDRYFGVRGALCALAGMLSVPLVLMVLVALAYAQFAALPAVAGAMRGMGAVVAGMVLGTGLRLLGALRSNPLGMKLCLVLAGLCFAAVVLLRPPQALVLAVFGLFSCGLAWRRLRP